MSYIDDEIKKAREVVGEGVFSNTYNAVTELCSRMDAYDKPLRFSKRMLITSALCLQMKSMVELAIVFTNASAKGR